MLCSTGHARGLRNPGQGPGVKWAKVPRALESGRLPLLFPPGRLPLPSPGWGAPSPPGVGRDRLPLSVLVVLTSSSGHGHFGSSFLLCCF